MSYSEYLYLHEKSRALQRMRAYPEVNDKIDELVKYFDDTISKYDKDAQDNMIGVYSSEDINPEVVAAVRKLNERFVIFIKVIREEFRKLYDTGFQRVQDKNDWVSDFEIAVKIMFALGEDDPDFDEDGDNIIGEYNDNLLYINDLSYAEMVQEEINSYSTNIENPLFHKKIKPEEYSHNTFVYSELWNHNVFMETDIDIIKNDYHTFILCDLYASQHLRIHEIARIKKIWFDMGIEYKKNKEVE